MNSVDTALLRALRSSAVHLPRNDLANLLRTTDHVVSEAVAGLRNAGFHIDERPGLGYRLVAAPDRLIADDLYARLRATRFIREILVFEETDSTNERLLQLGATGVSAGLVLFAEHQTAGRGRFTRQWESSSHRGLWFSMLLRPDFPLSLWPRLTIWAGVALAEAVEKSCGVRAMIKWPNDVELNGLKTAGILIETAVDRSGDTFAVLGIGLNVNHEREDFSPQLRRSATSLRIARRRWMDRAALAADVLESLASWHPRIMEDFPSILQEARRRSTLLGRAISLQNADERIQGVAEDLAEDGRLVIKLPDGRLETFGAGEVTVARA